MKHIIIFPLELLDLCIIFHLLALLCLLMLIDPAMGRKRILPPTFEEVYAKMGLNYENEKNRKKPVSPLPANHLHRFYLRCGVISAAEYFISFSSQMRLLLACLLSPLYPVIVLTPLRRTRRLPTFLAAAASRSIAPRTRPLQRLQNKARLRLPITIRVLNYLFLIR